MKIEAAVAKLNPKPKSKYLDWWDKSDKSEVYPLEEIGQALGIKSLHLIGVGLHDLRRRGWIEDLDAITVWAGGTRRAYYGHRDAIGELKKSLTAKRVRWASLKRISP